MVLASARETSSKFLSHLAVVKHKFVLFSYLSPKTGTQIELLT